ncbi:hypothetical protein [Hephaestia caeni]|uniref:hypothetical protein n=1 Tax=Hephaestia caeni TaxID=645617 RepID=UPI000E5BFB11|nr:hypothetical protein [Hephaestia caeni]
MRISRAEVALGAVALLLAGASIPALSQETPESILPPGFGDPAPTPAPTPTPTPRATPRPGASPSPRLVLPDLERPGATASPSPSPSGTPTPSPTETPDQASVLARYTLPAFARHSLARVGSAREGDGLRADAFGDADGRFLEALMRRLDTPLPSRWLHIGLRRMLASGLDTPGDVNGADFAAERAWLLIRMGEPVVARSLIQDVDTGNYTPKLLQVAMQAALATGDPAGLCPLGDVMDRYDDHTAGWPLARVMCAALGGHAEQADAALATVRRQRLATGIDLHLAEKVLGAASRRGAVTIEWTGVDQLTAWRYGLAMATGVEIPDKLYATVAPWVTGWRAQSPMLSATERAVPAQRAAARGVLSNVALVDLFGDIAAGEDSGSAAAAVASDLRSAYVDQDRDDRLSALRALWDAGDDPLDRYGRLVMTARAAARVAPADKTAEADTIVASMLTAGFDRAALRWQPHVVRGEPAWAMLALADPSSRARISYGDVDAVHDRDDANFTRSRLFLAGAAGLGRMSADDAERAAKELDLRIGAINSWTKAIDRAAAQNQPATVMLLAAVGMQGSDWRAVPPENLYHIVAALRATGLEGYARMIAAEAVGRV